MPLIYTTPNQVRPRLQPIYKRLCLLSWKWSPLKFKVFIVVLFIFFWEGLVRVFHLPPYIVPTPLEVARCFIHYASLIARHTFPTLVEMVIGLGLGFFWAIFIALSMCLFRPVQAFLLPLLLASQSVPLFAFAPLLVLWFGYGLMTKILITAFMLFFPISNSFFDGLRQTPEHYVMMAHIMNSSRWQILFQVRVPAAWPHLASGVRVATAMTPLSALMGEWVGSNQGLGFLLLSANAQMQIDLMMATLIVVFFLGISIYFLINRLLVLIMPWNEIK